MAQKIIKISMTILLIFVLLGLGSFFVLAYKSKSMTPPGLINQQLKACPNKPNCFCSENHPDVPANTQSLKLDHNPLPQFKTLIEDMNGKVMTHDETYLAATFCSSFFGFVDDLELRYDASQKVLHFRAASRVGYSDMGVNAKRLDQLKKAFEDLPKSS